MVGKHRKLIPRPGVDGLGRTPLHYAAGNGDNTEVSRLLTQGADPNAQDDNGWTSIHFAAQANSLACTELLIGAGANLELVDAHGNSILLRAVFASRGNGEVIHLLRASGADSYAANASGVTPIALARTITNYNVAQFFSDLP